MYAVYFYLRYTVYYRDLEEIIAERAVRVDHATLNRWVVKYSLIVAARAPSKRRSTLSSWRMEKTYIRVRGKWMYIYRAVDKAGNTLNFMLSERRNRPAAARFFAKALSFNGIPDNIVIDKSGANTAGIKAINKMLNGFGCPVPIEMVRWKYLRMYWTRAL